MSGGSGSVARNQITVNHTAAVPSTPPTTGSKKTSQAQNRSNTGIDPENAKRTVASGGKKWDTGLKSLTTAAKENAAVTKLSDKLIELSGGHYSSGYATVSSGASSTLTGLTAGISTYNFVRDRRLAKQDAAKLEQARLALQQSPDKKTATEIIQDIAEFKKAAQAKKALDTSYGGAATANIVLSDISAANQIVSFSTTTAAHGATQGALHATAHITGAVASPVLSAPLGAYMVYSGNKERIKANDALKALGNRAETLESSQELKKAAEDLKSSHEKHIKRSRSSAILKMCIGAGMVAGALVGIAALCFPPAAAVLGLAALCVGAASSTAAVGLLAKSISDGVGAKRSRQKIDTMIEQSAQDARQLRTRPGEIDRTATLESAFKSQNVKTNTIKRDIVRAKQIDKAAAEIRGKLIELEDLNFKCSGEIYVWGAKAEDISDRDKLVAELMNFQGLQPGNDIGDAMMAALKSFPKSEVDPKAEIPPSTQDKSTWTEMTKVILKNALT